MKKLLRAAVSRLLVPLVRQVVEEVSPPLLRYTVFDELNRRIAAESADYAQTKMATAVHFGNRMLLWDHALANCSLVGLIAEFGVANGDSINYLARRIAPETIYGFDSFRGLQVDWAGGGHGKGAFDRKGELPSVAANAKLIPGWFDETVQPFMAFQQRPLRFAHIDCDTYEATKAVLEAAGQWIVTGTVIVFDDYFDYRGWKIGGFKAWQEYVQRQNLRYRYIGFDSYAVSLLVL